MADQRPLLVTETEALALAQLLDAMRNVRGGARYLPGLGFVFERPSRAVSEPSSASNFFFLAEITDSLALGSTAARWYYAWREVEFDGDTYAVKSGGRSGTTGAAAGSDLGYALNINEMTITSAKSGTTAWYVDGVQANSTTASSAYPTGFAVRPIGGGGTSGTHKLNALVWMRDTTDKNGTRIFRFAAKVNHDGSCA